VPEPILDDSRETELLRSVSLRAPAKLNLSLVVHARRPDGNHQLETVMATIGLADELSLRVTSQPGIFIRATGITCPIGPDNLIWQAVTLLGRYANISPAIEIKLHKRIPLGGGLGGASSDAAVCLIGLNRLWNLDLSVAQLAKIAEELGSDVSFFLYAPVAYCRGRGEIVTPLSGRCQRSLLLILPDIHVSTAQIFHHFQHDPEESDLLALGARTFIDEGDLDTLVTRGINNLAPTCFQQFKKLRELKEAIEAMGLKSICLTGSGATLFATFERPEEAQEWAEQIKQRTDTNTLVTHFENHQDYCQENTHADY
jgi:4-diphosphocytidyl-2-C-methyl-D-erythritol kinase